MTESKNHMLGHTLLRVSIGGLFLFMGISKFLNPEGIIGMLGNIGFPAATSFGWILIFSEVVFGALILVGYKVRYNGWPLAVILVVALFTVVIPNDGFMSANSYFHLIGISGLVTIALTGPGKYAIKKIKIE